MFDFFHEAHHVLGVYVCVCVCVCVSTNTTCCLTSTDTAAVALFHIFWGETWNTAEV